MEDVQVRVSVGCGRRQLCVHRPDRNPLLLTFLCYDLDTQAFVVRSSVSQPLGKTAESLDRRPSSLLALLDKMNPEQAEEIEALQAIFAEGLEMIDGHTFDIRIEPFPGEENDIQVRLRVAYSETYPAELPFYGFKAVKGITQQELEPLTDYVKAVMLRDLGSPMVFDTIESVKEWLQSRVHEEEVQAQVEVPVVPKHATYTPVTAETFQTWRQQFIAEQQRLAAAEQEAKRNLVFINGITYGEVWTKPTGRQMFEKSNWTKIDVAEDLAEEETKEEDLSDYEEPLDLPDSEDY